MHAWLMGTIDQASNASRGAHHEHLSLLLICKSASALSLLVEVGGAAADAPLATYLLHVLAADEGIRISLKYVISVILK